MNEDVKEIAAALCDMIRYLEYKDKGVRADDLLLRLKRLHLQNLVEIVNKDQD